MCKYPVVDTIETTILLKHARKALRDVLGPEELLCLSAETRHGADGPGVIAGVFLSWLRGDHGRVWRRRLDPDEEWDAEDSGEDQGDGEDVDGLEAGDLEEGLAHAGASHEPGQEEELHGGHARGPAELLH